MLHFSGKRDFPFLDLILRSTIQHRKIPQFVAPRKKLLCGNSTQLYVLSNCRLFSSVVYVSVKEKISATSILLYNALILFASYCGSRTVVMNRIHSKHGGIWRTMHCRLCINCYRNRLVGQWGGGGGYHPQHPHTHIHQPFP